MRENEINDLFLNVDGVLAGIVKKRNTLEGND